MYGIPPARGTRQESWHQRYGISTKTSAAAMPVNTHLLGSSERSPRPLQKPCSLTPSLPQFVKCPWSKLRTYTPANSIFDGPIPSLLSLLYILIEIISRASAKGKKGFNDFRLGTLIGLFQSDGAASMAVKGLICMHFQVPTTAESSVETLSFPGTNNS